MKGRNAVLLSLMVLLILVPITSAVDEPMETDPIKVLDMDELFLNNVCGDWSPDGSMIVLGSWDDYIRVWDIQSSEYISNYEYDIGSIIFEVAWSPDGRSIAIGTGNDTAIVINIHTKDIVEMTGHNSSVISVDWSPDGEMICTGSHDGSVKIWNSTTAEMIHNMTENIYMISSIDWSPDGKRIVAGGRDSIARIWNTSSGDLEYSIPKQSDWINCVGWNHSSRSFITGTRAGYVSFWNWNGSGYEKKGFGRRFQAIGDFDVSLDGDMIVIGHYYLGKDPVIEIWDKNKNEYIREFDGHGDSINSAKWSPNDDLILTCSWDNTAKIWNVETGDMMVTLGYHYKYSHKWKDDQLYFASGGNIVYTWDTEEDQTAEIVLPENPMGQYAADRLISEISPDCGEYAFITPEEEIEVIDLTSGSIIGNYKTYFGYRGLRWSPDGSYLAALTYGELNIININTGDIKKTIDIDNNYRNMEWSPDGDLICLAPFEGSDELKIIDVWSDELLVNLSNHTGYISDISWSFDSVFVSSISTSNEVVTWDVRTGVVAGRFQVENCFSRNIEWSTENRIMAVSSWEDNHIRIVNPFSGKNISVLKRYDDTYWWFMDIKWSDDGNKLSAFSYKNVIVWSFSDSDGDGYNDVSDAFPNDGSEWADSDNDGTGDNADSFPLDPAASVDNDGDGYPDIWNENVNESHSTTGLEIDMFPEDPTEWHDSDDDGFGDNSDAFPYNSSEWYDTDDDGYGDNSDAFPYNSSEWYDTDGDGYGDNSDVFPDNSSEWIDTDNDDWGDNIDVFPFNSSEWVDTDQDGFGDNIDAYPDNYSEWIDSDGDGYGDNSDSFPLNSSEWIDTDNDNWGDNIDVFPFNSSEWMDTDGDRVGDNSDLYPTDPDEWEDSDGDGVPDNSDDFKNDPSASLDTDGDGLPDRWNEGYSGDDTTTGLVLDKYPDDPSKWEDEEDAPDYGTYITFCLISIVIVIILIFITGMFLIMKRIQRSDEGGELPDEIPEDMSTNEKENDFFDKDEEGAAPKYGSYEDQYSSIYGK